MDEKRFPPLPPTLQEIDEADAARNARSKVFNSREEYESVQAALDEEFPDIPLKRIDPVLTAIDKRIGIESVATGSEPQLSEASSASMALDSTGSAQRIQASARSSIRKKLKPGAVELGHGGVRFVRQGELTLAESCSNTTSAVAASFKLLSAELPKVFTVVKSGKGLISGEELRKQFRGSVLAKVADKKDWNGWAEDFSLTNPNRGRPRGAALTFLERKMNLDRKTIKTYVSRAKSAAKKKKSTTRNPS